VIEYAREIMKQPSARAPHDDHWTSRRAQRDPDRGSGSAMAFSTGARPASDVGGREAPAAAQCVERREGSALGRGCERHSVPRRNSIDRNPESWSEVKSRPSAPHESLARQPPWRPQEAPTQAPTVAPQRAPARCPRPCHGSAASLLTTVPGTLPGSWAPASSA
jgi:hypothetical protein